MIANLLFKHFVMVEPVLLRLSKSKSPIAKWLIDKAMTKMYLRMMEDAKFLITYGNVEQIKTGAQLLQQMGANFSIPELTEKSALIEKNAENLILRRIGFRK